jgi:predicted  nucleic acid-binding Zn-ribbon protein
MSEQPAVHRHPEAPKVHTEHKKANEAIESLRAVAATLQQVGNELTHTTTDKKKLEEEVTKLTEQVAEMEEQVALGGEALEALEDFKRDLCDRDELLQRTVGRP